MQDDDQETQSQDPALTGWDQGSVEQLKAELKAAHTKGIVKDLWKHGDDHLAASYYRWWWQFVRVGANDQQLRDQLLADTAKATAFRAVVQDFVPNSEDFNQWWRDRGHALFKEPAVPYINPWGTRVATENGTDTPTLLLEVPLNISRDLLRKQFDAIVDHYYPDEFMRHAASTADRKIVPAKKDRTFEFEYLLDVWRHKRANPDMHLWEIHCVAIKDQDLQKRLKKEANTSDERQDLTKKVERAFKQADELMQNALIGSFPNDGQFQKKKGRTKKRTELSKTGKKKTK